MRARLLQFVTGTSKVPMNGFAELQGTVHYTSCESACRSIQFNNDLISQAVAGLRSFV